jgi:hypothetical protein
METDVVAHNDGEDRAEWMMADDDGIQYFIDPDVGVDGDSIASALRQHPELRSIASWVQDINPAYAATNHRNRSKRSGGIIERDRYVTPDGFFDQFRVARDAAMHDDSVSNVLETTEALVFNTIRVDCEDPDEENVWNQIISDMGLDAALHQMWRELFTYSQFNCALQWGARDYKVEGKGKKRSRRKAYDLNVVTSLSMLDQLKVIPVGDFLFGGEALVYAANRVEAASIDDVLAGNNTTDQVVKNLLTERMHTDQAEKSRLADLLGEGDFSNLFYIKPGAVFRHTATKPDYERFAAVRMASIFELLDLKHQLRQMDRAHLMGATNFIVLIKKGSDQQPATSGEISHLNASVKTVARTPLIVGDHRLSVEIVTPKIDTTLDPKRYNNLDSRIAARLYQMFHIGGFSAGASGDDSLKLIRVVARGLEARRQSIRTSVEKNVLAPIFEANPDLKTKPKLQFTPRNVALDFDPNFIQLMLSLYNDGALSRDTMLGMVDVDQADEAHRRELEKETGWDKIFEPRNANNGMQGGIKGGNNNGGGTNPDSNVSNPRPRRPDADIPAGDE